MKRLIRRATACVGLAACMMLGGIGTASAVPIDSWQTSQQIINGAAGSSYCTIGASTPARSANLIAGSASISCTKRYVEIHLTVCIQSKPVLAESAMDWVEIGCSPPKRVGPNTQGTSHSHTVQCLPGHNLYRVQANSEGYQVGDTTDKPTFALVFHGGAMSTIC